jgi:hypothetical protein
VVTWRLHLKLKLLWKYMKIYLTRFTTKHK